MSGDPEGTGNSHTNLEGSISRAAASFLTVDGRGWCNPISTLAIVAIPTPERLASSLCESARFLRQYASATALSTSSASNVRSFNTSSLPLSGFMNLLYTFREKSLQSHCNTLSLVRQYTQVQKPMSRKEKPMTTESTEENTQRRKGHFKCNACGMWTPYRDMHEVTEENESFSAYFPGEKFCPDDAKHAGIL